jgi:hypothetical protein
MRLLASPVPDVAGGSSADTVALSDDCDSHSRRVMSYGSASSLARQKFISSLNSGRANRAVWLPGNIWRTRFGA